MIGKMRSFAVRLLLTCKVFKYEQAINRYLTACHSKLFFAICFCFGLAWLHLAYRALFSAAKSYSWTIHSFQYMGALPMSICLEYWQRILFYSVFVCQCYLLSFAHHLNIHGLIFRGIEIWDEWDLQVCSTSEKSGNHQEGRTGCPTKF